MSRETETADRGDGDSDDRRWGGWDPLDGRLLSDLSVNIVPIGIIAVFTLLFVARSPTGAGDSVLLFHAALVGGVVLVSAVAGWAISRVDAPLEGSVARSHDPESDRE